MLYYCEKCGGVSVLDFDICTQCGSHNSFKPVPEEYIIDDYAIKNSMKEQFIENIVKASPNFDPKCWDRREAFIEIQKRNSELLESDKIKQANAPKCPTCSSTSVKKISTMSKVAGASMFGLFSKTARSQFKCENCGYKW